MEKINKTQSKRGYLFRASSSDICNYDCAFCHPNDNEPVDILTNREFTNIFKVANSIFKLKTLHFTGGEPLMRKDISDLIGRCRDVVDSKFDIALTSNASLLDRHVDDLIEAGLSRINISLHTLDPLKYKAFTGTNMDVDKVKQNIIEAKEKGLIIKLNMVAIKGFNDSAILDSVKYAFDQGLILRFLELGLYGPVINWFDKNNFMPHDEILSIVNKEFGPFERDLTYRGNGPTKYYKNKYGKIFGILDNQSDKYCCGCDRFRMTANGIIKACNFPDLFDLKPILDSPIELRKAFMSLGDILSSRGEEYIGKRDHICDYNFRWNHPENSSSLKTPICEKKCY
jgi:GTP 3',8-cyclase